jgi:serine protease Do
MLKHVLTVAAGFWCAAAHGLPFDQTYWIAISAGVVKIEVSRSGGYSLGTGVVIDRGKVVTACHVLRGGSRVAVLYAGIRHGAVVQAQSAEHDLCLLQVARLEAPPASLRPTSQLAIGEDVGAIGFSAGAGVHHAHGTVDRLHRYDEGVVVQGSAAFTSGASGGGLFDADKRLVGILMFRMRGAGGQYFSAPVEWIASELTRNGGQSADPELVEISGEPFWSRAPDRLPYFMRANLLMSEQRWDELQALLPQWQLDDPASAEPAFLTGELDSRRGRTELALIDYREAVARDPSHALAWDGLVRASIHAQELGAARQAYGKLTTLSSVLSSRVANEFPEVLK